MEVRYLTLLFPTAVAVPNLYTSRANDVYREIFANQMANHLCRKVAFLGMPFGHPSSEKT